MSPDVMAWALAQPEGSAAYGLAQVVLGGVETVRSADGASVTYRTVAEAQLALASAYAAAQPASGRRPLSTVARVGGGW